MTSHLQHFYLLYQSLHCPGPAVLQPWVQCVLSTGIRKGLLLSAVLLTTNKTLVTKVTWVLLLWFFFCSQRKQYSPSPFGGALAPQMKQGSIVLNPERRKMGPSRQTLWPLQGTKTIRYLEVRCCSGWQPSYTACGSSISQDKLCCPRLPPGPPTTSLGTVSQPQETPLDSSQDFYFQATWAVTAILLISF